MERLTGAKVSSAPESIRAFERRHGSRVAEKSFYPLIEQLPRASQVHVNSFLSRRMKMASGNGDLRVKANWHMSQATDGGNPLRAIWNFVRYWLPAAALAILYGALRAFFS
jgi:hypothetical protein